ncbi:MAG: MBL fold metallo-hydrolase [Candidatus Excrementavichristensenella sp.]|jgi:metallo-beta-lactamase class B
MNGETYMETEMEIMPFAMVENCYFVGGREVSVHLIDTGDGLILIDTGYPHMRAQILANVCSLGFRTEDIRVILLTHGHYDHIGCAAVFREMSGAPIYIGREDAGILKGALDLSWAQELGFARLSPFEADVLIEDGAQVTLGDVTVRCVHTPGHTAGTMSFFFETPGQAHYTVGMHGGVGLNSMQIDFLRRKGLNADCREAFRAGLRRLADISVDVMLGNHPDQNHTAEKRALLYAGEACACVDRCEWPRFLRTCEENLDDMLRMETIKNSL